MLVDWKRRRIRNRPGGEYAAAAGRVEDHHLGPAVVGVEPLGQSQHVCRRTEGDLVRLMAACPARTTLVQALLAENVPLAQAGAGEGPVRAFNHSIWSTRHCPGRSKDDTEKVRFRFHAHRKPALF